MSIQAGEEDICLRIDQSKNQSEKRRAFSSRSKYVRLLCLFLLLPLFEVGCTEKKEFASKDENTLLKTGVEVGNFAPDFKIKNLTGGETALSEYKGKVVLLNFWATWCGPCRAEMPSMEALYRSYPRNKFEILAVSIDFGQDAPVKEFIDDFGFTFPVLLDDQLEVNNRYQIRVVPTSILVDQKGVVTHRLLGAKDWNDPDSKLFVDKLIAASS